MYQMWKLILDHYLKISLNWEKLEFFLLKMGDFSKYRTMVFISKHLCLIVKSENSIYMSMIAWSYKFVPNCPKIQACLMQHAGTWIYLASGECLCGETCWQSYNLKLLFSMQYATWSMWPMNCEQLPKYIKNLIAKVYSSLTWRINGLSAKREMFE